jgi:hypothetical protein
MVVTAAVLLLFSTAVFSQTLNELKHDDTYADHVLTYGMGDPQRAFDLRTLPRAQKRRFVALVMSGKHNMPPWGDLLTSEDIEALAYSRVGEKP